MGGYHAHRRSLLLSRLAAACNCGLAIQITLSILDEKGVHRVRQSGTRNKICSEQNIILFIGFLFVLAVISWICALLWEVIPSLILSGTVAIVGTIAYFNICRKRRTDALEHNDQIFKSLFDYSPNGIVLVDLHGRIQKINDKASGFAGYTIEDLRMASLSSYIHKEDIEKTKYHFKRTRKGYPQNFDTSVIHRKGFRVDLHVTSVPISVNEKMVGVFMICVDITEQKRTDERIRHMAYYDDLTGLPNRRLFKDQLDETLTYLGPDETIAVLMMDIDRFKLVNDSLGHDYGDILLLQVAERLTRCVNEGEGVARMEGDEFALFFLGANSENWVEQRVSVIFKVFEAPFQLQDYEIHITVSIGGVMLSESDKADSLMKNADTALSRAKDQGKNNFQLYTAAMNIRSFERLTLENELRRAYDYGEFELYYQPQMHIESGLIVGAEALIRWNHPIQGMVPPGKFIPLAEENGMIVPIGDWVISTACNQVKTWQNLGLPKIPVSVNLSSRQFLQQNLVSKIKQVLDTTGLDPKWLELEITESMTFDVNRTIDLLVDLKQLGINISIDDFGTGYSSLSYLKKFPIYKLKIDRSFVRDIMVDPNDAAIVSTIISIANHLKLKVIAEGVETEDQLKFLWQNECHEVQGYYFSPPISAQDFQHLLVRQLEAPNEPEIS